MKTLLIIGTILPNILGIIVNDPPETGIAYKYSYDIDDPTTGDSKSQQESGNGANVFGSYSVLDPDGIKRTVSYTADARYGFKAIVHRVPTRPVSGLYVPEPNAGVFAPTAVYPHDYVHRLPIAQSLYTSAISAPTSFATYSVNAPHNSIPYSPVQKQEAMQVEQRRVYFQPTQERKSILRDSLGPGQYFEPASRYHK